MIVMCHCFPTTHKSESDKKPFTFSKVFSYEQKLFDNLQKFLASAEKIWNLEVFKKRPWAINVSLDV